MAMSSSRRITRYCVCVFLWEREQVYVVNSYGLKAFWSQKEDSLESLLLEQVAFRAARFCVNRWIVGEEEEGGLGGQVGMGGDRWLRGMSLL